MSKKETDQGWKELQGETRVVAVNAAWQTFLKLHINTHTLLRRVIGRSAKSFGCHDKWFIAAQVCHITGAFENCG